MTLSTYRLLFLYRFYVCVNKVSNKGGVNKGGVFVFMFVCLYVTISLQNYLSDRKTNYLIGYLKIPWMIFRLFRNLYLFYDTDDDNAVPIRNLNSSIRIRIKQVVPTLFNLCCHFFVSVYSYFCRESFCFAVSFLNFCPVNFILP